MPSPPCNRAFEITNESNDGMALLGDAVGCGGVDPVAVPEDLAPAEVDPPEDASNDADTPATNMATSKSCFGSDVAADLTNAKSKVLPFDYEIHTIDGADLMSALEEFEIALLDAVATDYNLTNCEISTSALPVRRSLRSDYHMALDSSVVGVGSYPLDVLDEAIDDCTSRMRVSITSTGSSTCTPINGYMTAWETQTSNRRLFESDIYSLIENFSQNYTSDEVLAISYVGNRAASMPFIDKAVVNDGYHDDLAPASSKLTPGAVAGIVIASIVGMLALAVVLLKVVKRRRERQNANKDNAKAGGGNTLYANDDEEEMKEVKDDSSLSVETEEYTKEEAGLTPCATFESEDPSDNPGFEVKL
ncbi:hypothetical protein ACHAWF_015783 [Thalassiosira exigua]